MKDDGRTSAPVVPRQATESVPHLPPESGANPYLDNLTTALNRHGQPTNGETNPAPYVFSILRSARAHNTDLVHIHWLETFYRGSTFFETATKSITFLLELILVNFSGLKIVWTIHNTTPHEATFPRAYILLSHIVARVSTRIVVHSDASRDEIVQKYRLSARMKDKIDVIPHGNYIDNYPDTITRENAKSQLDLDKEHTVFLFIGKIRPYKGVPSLITAFRDLEGPNLRLLIVGSPHTDAYGAELEHRVAGDPRILLHPKFVPDEELQLYLNAADAVTLPFNEVLSSGSAMLALSFGCPIIVPDKGCLADLTQGVIRYGPDKGIADGLQQACESNLDQLATEARAYANECDWDSVAEATRETYYKARNE